MNDHLKHFSKKKKLPGTNNTYFSFHLLGKSSLKESTYVDTKSEIGKFCYCRQSLCGCRCFSSLESGDPPEAGESGECSDLVGPDKISCSEILSMRNVCRS